ncbi:hypothetical protein FRB90_005020 [Tulasnella sp. 427]|nr:hypothetical protein FRB90_005020 [Tulasnella sp. 427]
MRTCDQCVRWTTYFYIPVLVIHTAIIVLTVRRSFIPRSQRKAAPILATFFRDGMTYFVVAFATALVNILLFAFGPWAIKSWISNYLRPLISSMATRLLLNLHDQVSQTACYTDPPTTINGRAGDRLSTVEFAVLPRARDVESDGMGEGLNDDSLIGGNTLELNPLETGDPEGLNDGQDKAFNLEGAAAPENE